jgi:hypothetical protein
VLAASLPDLIAHQTGWDKLVAIRLMFVAYGVLGLVSLLLYGPLTPAIEAAATPMAPLGPSRRLVYGMTALFAMDAFGTGFVVQSLLALRLYQKFGLSVTTAAAILFWSNVCSAVSYLVAVPLARRIGLVNTMVFTHLPSNLFHVLVPFAPSLGIAIGLLLARSALSQMDVPTRSFYVMAVAAPEERPAAASVTAVPRTFAWAAGSIISGYLLSLSGFGWPLVSGGLIKGCMTCCFCGASGGCARRRKRCSVRIFALNHHVAVCHSAVVALHTGLVAVIIEDLVAAGEFCSAVYATGHLVVTE